MAQPQHINPVAKPCRTGQVRRLIWLAAWVTALLMPSQLSAEERTPADDRIIKLTLPLDTGNVTGVIATYNTLTFTLQTEQDEHHRVLWNAIPADNVNRYWRFLEQPEGDAQALFELGDLLIRHRDGEPLAKQAFDQALALDPGLTQAIERSLAGKEPDGTPRFVGTADPAMWGNLTDETMQQGVETLHAFCQRVQRELELELKLYESPRFMLLTDTDPKQVQSLSEKLVEDYRVIAELLGDDPDANVFVGKCLVVLFDKRIDYIRFQDKLHSTDARGTGGLCHGFGNGHAHVAAFRRPNPRQTHHVVVHEFVHAYLHRYQSPRPLDDWVNEGLAEFLAHEIEPPPGQDLALKSRFALQGKQGLGEGFYDGETLAAWQYDIAGALTGYLFDRGGHAYPKFIAALKGGQATADALKDIYRMTPQELTQRFKRHLDRELNRKLGG